MWCWRGGGGVGGDRFLEKNIESYKLKILSLKIIPLNKAEVDVYLWNPGSANA